MWATEPSCQNIIEQNQFAHEENETSVSLVKNLEDYKKALIKWSKEVFPNNMKAVDSILQEIQKLQNQT